MINIAGSRTGGNILNIFSQSGLQPQVFIMIAKVTKTKIIWSYAFCFYVTDKMSRTESDSTNSTDGGLDMTFDSLCCQCIKEDRHVESSMFCIQCKELFCLPCSKKHTKVAATQDHDVVCNDKRKTSKSKNSDIVEHDKDKKSLRSLSRTSLRDHCICHRHEGQRLTKFCEEDDTYCCPECIRNDHKLCSEFINIPAELYNDELKKRLKELDPTLKDIKKKLENLKKENLRTVQKLETQKAQILGTILDYRKRVDELFDRLEKAAVEELEKRFKECNKGVHQTIASIQELVDKQKDIDKKAKKDIEVFIKIQKTQMHISEANKTIQRMDAAVGVQSIIFNIDPSVQSVLESIRTFGAFSSVPHEYKLSHRGDFAVTDDDIPRDSNISATCLPDGKVIVASSSAPKLLLLNTSFKVVSKCELEECPGGMCRTSPKEIIVCLPHHKILQFIYVDRNIKRTRSFRLEIECFSVAHHNREIYVISAGRGTVPGQIYVYNMSAKLLRTIGNDMFRDPIFGDPFQIVASPDGSKIFVSDGIMGLMCLTKTGALVKRYKSKSLELPYGLTVDPAGNVFVCGSYSNNILHVNPDGGDIREVLNEQDGILVPLSVCLDYKRSLMIVTLTKSKQIKVYSMT